MTSEEPDLSSNLEFKAEQRACFRVSLVCEICVWYAPSVWRSSRLFFR